MVCSSLRLDLFERNDWLVMIPYLLVVDDQAWMNLLFSLILERHGYKVRTMRDGKEALASIQRTLPDLVLLDIVMPEVSGVDVLEFMADDPATASTPVLVVSTLDEELVPLKHIRQKMHVDFLGKPFKPAQLVSKVQRCLKTVHAGKFDYVDRFQSAGSMASL